MIESSTSVTEGVDLSFRLEPNLGENLIVNQLGFIQRAMVASPSCLDSHEPIRSPSDLIKHPFIHVKGIFNSKISLKTRGKPTSPRLE